ncbi:hypothetical protein TD95_000575 [Thielaviopsis punctulata]|uniref:TauD/TfdA-like domain-containing protein n=1 Tax=Thielaviopsis punctulata TaxID=72032 RepID=A0A0F4ZM03_9PEZI|nr:hypothetical protein TD95_000575 [Thielaviopsis punctulata]
MSLLVPLKSVSPATLAATQASSSTLPAGFPAVLPNAWTGETYANDKSYILQLTASEIAEVEAAMEHFKTCGLDGGDISPASFPLPTLAPKLIQVSHDLYSGRGFALIRGLDVTRHSSEDQTLMWLGIQSYIANKMARQDARGNMLVHIVADNSSALAAGHHRHSTSAITFHTEDSGDIVSWLTRSTAQRGGRCVIASANEIYNRMAQTCPDMIRTLAKGDWPFALPTFNCRPIFYFHDNNFLVNFGRAPLLGSAVHPRPSTLPCVSPAQLAALDMLEALAQATQLEIQTQPGDLHFINNFNVLHRREAFVNGDEPTAKRHLVRMRVRSEERGWSIPAELQQPWQAAFGDEGDRKWHLEPMTSDVFPLRYHTN